MGQGWSGERGDEGACLGDPSTAPIAPAGAPRRRVPQLRRRRAHSAIRGARGAESRPVGGGGGADAGDSPAISSPRPDAPGNSVAVTDRAMDEMRNKGEHRARGRRGSSDADPTVATCHASASHGRHAPVVSSRAAYVQRSAYCPEMRAHASARAIERALAGGGAGANCLPRPAKHGPPSQPSPAASPPPHPRTSVCDATQLTDADVDAFTSRASAALVRGAPAGGGWGQEVEEGVLDGRGFVRVFMRAAGGGVGVREVLAVCELPARAQGAMAALWNFSEYMQWDHHFTRMITCAHVPRAAGRPAQRRDHAVMRALPFPLNHVVAPRDFVIAQAAIRVSAGLAVVMKDSSSYAFPGPPRGHVRARLVGVGGVLIAEDSADSGRCRIVMTQCVDMRGAIPPSVVALVLRHTPPRWATRLARHVQRKQEEEEEEEAPRA